MHKRKTRLRDHGSRRNVFYSGLLFFATGLLFLPSVVQANFDYVCWSSETTCSANCENWSAWDEASRTRTCVTRRAYRTGKWGNTRVRCSTSDQFDTWQELMDIGDSSISGYGNSLNAETMTTREGILFIGSRLGLHTAGSASEDRWETVVNGNTCTDVLMDYDYNPPRTTLRFRNK